MGPDTVYKWILGMWKTAWVTHFFQQSQGKKIFLKYNWNAKNVWTWIIIHGDFC